MVPTVAAPLSDRPSGALACPLWVGIAPGGDPITGWPPVEVPPTPGGQPVDTMIACSSEDYTAHFTGEMPLFSMIDPDELERELRRISVDMRRPICDGVRLFLRTHRLTDLVGERDRIWWLAVKTSRYAAIYFLSRAEARANTDYTREYTELIDAAGRMIDEHGGVGPIVNYALHRWVEDYAGHLDRQVRTVTTSTPPHAVQGYATNVIALRARHFYRMTAEQCFHHAVGHVHDWHDLAHVLAAAASDGRFGVKYHDGLDRLPRHYRALTEGEGAAEGTGPVFSDGLLFSHLSTPLFDHYLDLGHGYTLIQELLAAELTGYLSGRHGLRHPLTGATITPDRAIDPLELAVCIQNKRYERRAAEIETTLLVRGTPDGPRGDPGRDPLLPLSRSQRLLWIAALDEPLYFEVRNLCRHRAHEDALGRYAHRMCHRAPELAYPILDFYHLADLRDGRELNLYQLALRVLNKAA